LTPPEQPPAEPLARPLGLTVILVIGLLASFIGGLLLLLMPWWVPDIRQRLPELAASVLALSTLLLLCFALWTHAGWTWWLLVVPSYSFGVLALLVAWSGEDPFYRLRDSVRALLYLAGVVWYSQFKPSVVAYYAGIRGLRERQRSRSRQDAA